jgi:membrane protein required for colicin V production
MNTIDIIIAIPLLWGIWQGFSKGLILVLASLVALLLGIWGAIKFSSFTAGVLSESFGLKSEYNSMIAFSVTFILIVVGIHLLAYMLDKLFKAVALGLVMKISGAVVSLAKWALIVSVLISLYGVINVDNKYTSKETLDKSLLYKPVSAIAPAIFSYLDFDWIKQVSNEHLQPKKTE